MNALDLARTAYSSAAAPIRTHQSTEFDVFAQITGRIKSAMARGKLGFADLAAALDDNRKLWVLLASDVADPGNALPRQLRAQIVYLAEFSMLHTTKVLDGKASAEVLVDINTSIMRGLRQQESAR
ncbi:flagellar protein FlaF [Candidatus Rhodobacter oscarellae]|uniref:Flagellar protein FlaF n=1 Tax=Candidatus Rhodobacter oscarellae TaxID=1675527 RepID=A0A0J9H0F5_9RHOB|nr:flagellar biosynthesis regulator FlaF [Candidatus Rhodobacter lobularis]KMW59218.1 flagellar protein FlaF [Candidatus Rhodobacter lobularis]